jgi:putative peptidoglycan lipid II flippase
MTDSARTTSRLAAIFAGGTMISRLTGLARDIAIGACLPPSSRAAFWIAFRYPNMLRDIIGEGAMNAAFVPVYSETLEKESREAFRVLVSAALGMMLVVLASITLVGMVLVPLLPESVNSVSAITGAEHRTDQDIIRIATLTRWCFPYVFFIGLAVFAMGPLFALKQYGTSSWSPALLNIALIVAAIIVLEPSWFGISSLSIEPAFVLVFAVWFGGAAHVVVQFLALRKHAGVFLPVLRFRHPGVHKVLWLMVPVLIGQAAGEVNKVVDTQFAVSLGDAAVNALTYANRLVQLPLGVFGVATSVAILPIISRAAARGEDDEVRKTLMHGFRQSAFLVFPATLGLIALGEPVIRLLFQWKHFSAEDTANTTIALLPFAASLPAFAWVKICLSGFYAQHQTRTPVAIATLSMMLNIGLNILFIKPLGFPGLALATLIAQCVNFIILYLVLGKRYGALWDGEFFSALVRIIAASVTMSVFAYGIGVKLSGIFTNDSLVSRLTIVAVPIAVAIVVYVGLCFLLRVEEVKRFVGAFSGERD